MFRWKTFHSLPSDLKIQGTEHPQFPFPLPHPTKIEPRRYLVNTAKEKPLSISHLYLLLPTVRPVEILVVPRTGVRVGFGVALAVDLLPLLLVEMLVVSRPGLSSTLRFRLRRGKRRTRCRRRSNFRSRFPIWMEERGIDDGASPALSVRHAR